MKKIFLSIFILKAPAKNYTNGVSFMKPYNFNCLNTVQPIYKTNKQEVEKQTSSKKNELIDVSDSSSSNANTSNVNTPTKDEYVKLRQENLQKIKEFCNEYKLELKEKQELSLKLIDEKIEEFQKQLPLILIEILKNKDHSRDISEELMTHGKQKLIAIINETKPVEHLKFDIHALEKQIQVLSEKLNNFENEIKDQSYFSDKSKNYLEILTEENLPLLWGKLNDFAQKNKKNSNKGSYIKIEDLENFKQIQTIAFNDLAKRIREIDDKYEQLNKELQKFLQINKNLENRVKHLEDSINNLLKTVDVLVQMYQTSHFIRESALMQITKIQSSAEVPTSCQKKSAQYKNFIPKPRSKR